MTSQFTAPKIEELVEARDNARDRWTQAVKDKAELAEQFWMGYITALNAVQYERFPFVGPMEEEQ